MRKILTILCVLFSVAGMAQFPNTHTQSSPYTKEVFNGSTNPKKGLINGRYSDTAAANRDYVAGEKGIQIVVGNTIYMRDSTATKWIVAGGYGVTASNITILNDSSISICNTNSCDTFKFTNIVVNNFSVLNDSTILVCDGNNTCDTLHIAPTPIAKPYVDSVKLISGVLYYYINGNAYPSGNVSGIANGLISGGIVTWSGNGLKYYVSPATYVISNIYYHSGLDSVTLAAPPTVNSRIDLIGVDITGHAFVDTGIVSATPIVPQAKLGIQVALTTGILLNAGDTIPANVIVTMVYNENLGEPDEWSTHTENAPITADFNNTVNPKKGLKDIFISRYNSQSIVYFAISTPYTLSSDAVVSGWIYLNKRLENNIYAFLYNSNTGARTNAIPLSLDKFDSISYQQFAFQTSNFTWSGNSNNQFNTIEFYFSGNDTVDMKGLYIDYVTIQKGVGNIPPPTDYSNKLDSVTIKKIIIGSDTANIALNWIKGVSYPQKDTIWTHFGGNGIDSSAYSFTTQTSDTSYELKKRNGGKTVFIFESDTTGSGGGGGGGGIQSVTGLNTDNTDPLNPIVKISVDGTTITGLGTPASPLVSHGTGGITSVVGGTNITIDNTDPSNPIINAASSSQVNSDWNSSSGVSQILNKPIIPAQFTPIAGVGISMSGTYPDVTFNADTLLLSTKLWRQKGIDSVQANINVNTAAISANTSNITTNTTNIAANTAAIGNKADKATTLTINGITHDLSTNQSWTIASGSSDVKQEYTGSTSVTVTDSTITWLVINPASLSSAMTITMPSVPRSNQKIEISFGGTITSGVVVSNVTISPNTGQAVLQSSAPSTVMAGETISYRFNATNSKWYRIN